MRSGRLLNGGLIRKFGDALRWSWSQDDLAQLPDPVTLRARIRIILLSWLGLVVYLAAITPGSSVVAAGLALVGWLVWVFLGDIEISKWMSSQLGELYEILAWAMYSFVVPATALYIVVPLLSAKSLVALLFGLGGLLWVLGLSILEYRHLYRPIRRPLAIILYVICVAVALFITRSSITVTPRGVDYRVWLTIWLALGFIAGGVFYRATLSFTFRKNLFAERGQPDEQP
jgi:hypothetical protein